MVGAFDQNKLLRLCRPPPQSPQLGARAELIAPSADKQFRLATIAQEFKCVGARLFGVGGYWDRWNSQAYQGLHARIRTRRPQADRRAKRKPCKNQRQMILGVEPV